MSASANLSRARDATAAFWNDRSVKERKQLLVIGTIIALALTFLLFIDPALSGRTQLRKNLPVLRQNAADMQQLTREVATMLASVPPPPPVLTKESVEAGLSARGLKSQSVVVTDEVVRIQLPVASFAALVDWLDEMQKTARLSVMDASITALPASDSVSATLTLRQQKSESARE
ncbi:general secretion pathway protein M [Actimicrobium sp. GrIS 1.19]|uniref:type II secretion system protein GspM n=1 Tax=Actimicrobium sp. GrIS 1.19 TaxID=3071708 RepID=UPI002E020CF4|nr:general secretion pathway protein M [Actimicrobium sp. GrIS 1.19]